MKIHGLNKMGFNPYLRNVNKHAEIKDETQRSDQLEISNQAKHLQETKKDVSGRTQYIRDIKQSIQTGNYQVDITKTAKKMIDVWSKQS